MFLELVTKADASGITPMSMCRAKCEASQAQCTTLIHPIHPLIHPQKCPLSIYTVRVSVGWMFLEVVTKADSSGITPMYIYRVASSEVFFKIKLIYFWIL